MQTRNDVDEYRPILRTIGAFLVYLVALGVTKGEKGNEIVRRCYETADIFIEQLSADLDERPKQ